MLGHIPRFSQQEAPSYRCQGKARPMPSDTTQKKNLTPQMVEALRWLEHDMGGYAYDQSVLHAGRSLNTFHALARRGEVRRLRAYKPGKARLPYVFLLP